MLDISKHPTTIVVPRDLHLPRFPAVWTPLTQGSIKINVDVSYTTGSNQAGIGGTFRYHEGSILLHFNKHVQANSMIQSEALIIREGFLIAVVSRWSQSSSFVIELDSENGVSWFSNSSLNIWRLKYHQRIHFRF